MTNVKKILLASLAILSIGHTETKAAAAANPAAQALTPEEIAHMNALTAQDSAAMTAAVAGIAAGYAKPLPPAVQAEHDARIQLAEAHRQRVAHATSHKILMDKYEGKELSTPAEKLTRDLQIKQSDEKGKKLEMHFNSAKYRHENALAALKASQ